MEFVSPTDGPYVMVQGKKYLDFSSCDFLGLAQHPEVKKAAIKYTLKYGVGIPVSPLRSGPQQQLEGKLAQLLGAEAALLFPSFDEAHQLLKSQKKLSFQDESFTLGMSGENGFGNSKTELSLGSLAFAAGCSGAYIAGPKKLLSSWTPSEPLSFPVLGAIDSALSFIPEMDQERKTLEKNTRWLQSLLKEFPAKMSKSPKALLDFKSDKEALQVRDFFAADQIFLAPAEGTTLYIAMTALHTPDDLDQLALTLKKLSETDLALAMQSLTPTP